MSILASVWKNVDPFSVETTLYNAQFLSPLLTTLGEKLWKNLFKSFLVDETRGTFLFKTAIDKLYFLPGESGVGRQCGKLLRLVPAAKGKGTGGGTP